MRPHSTLLEARGVIGSFSVPRPGRQLACSTVHMLLIVFDQIMSVAKGYVHQIMSAETG